MERFSNEIIPIGGECVMSIYAVNGKVPIAVWCPSRDDVGNGTSTLRDLVGSNNGTLTNMDPATDWVADSGAGGIRALDFDGVDDTVNCGTIAGLNGASKATLSAWIWRGATSVRVGLGAVAGPITPGGNRFSILWFSDNNMYIQSEAASLAYGVTALTGTGWRHVVVVYDGTLTGNANRLKLWVDNTQRTLTYTGTIPATLGTVTPQFSLGRDSSNRFDAGRIDDVRLALDAWDASDVAYLWNSGNGRGRSNTGSPYRRNNFFISNMF